MFRSISPWTPSLSVYRVAGADKPISRSAGSPKGSPDIGLSVYRVAGADKPISR